MSYKSCYGRFHFAVIVIHFVILIHFFPGDLIVALRNEGIRDMGKFGDNSDAVKCTIGTNV